MEAVKDSKQIKYLINKKRGQFIYNQDVINHEGTLLVEWKGVNETLFIL